MKAIEFNAVGKDFGQFTALKEVSFAVEQGDFFALLGPNGAGKTTLISILAGLTKATRGSTRVMGLDVQQDYRAARRAVGIVPQELVFDPFFNVREALVFQSGYFGIKHNDAWIDEILHNLGLTEKAHTNMRALSGGMKRRVMVAQALVHKPPVIVLDEPTAGVDVELRQTLWAFVKNLNENGHTIVLTTHYLEEAETLCNRIAMLKRGELIALEDKDTMMQRGAARSVILKLKPAQLPASLQSLLIKQHEGRFELKLADCNGLEAILAALRAEQITLKDLEITQPDLEEIFVQMMHA
ncbi:ABC transporter ATP-binding protein [Chitinibacter fontanus]|uniref:ABC transporter ATP-binding protein n=1 Tax=Chitinibacter fontanus TaxID=1737446 RepID=A0A7D5Z400_9NEIS|nr:ABC transporter ATP-binding protein [Chitinibacter fontanus]QLI81821.1 ABC transporter ATP-binding protein [Chitinibacter fontanus]